MRRLVLVAFAVASTACQRSHLTTTAGDVEVSPAELDFGEVAITKTARLALTLRNTSLSPRAGHVSSPAPFALEQDVTVPGGASTSIDVVFSPTALGPFAAALTFSVDSDTLTVALAGTGLPPPTCAPPIDCRTCDGVVQADGTACASSNRCLGAGTCLQGICLGTAISCDDGNACTLDACDPTAGCAHSDTSQRCPAPEDPCAAALCDPAHGCTSAVAPDGTRCGPSDCATAHVCIAGQCKQMAVPEGFACGPASPCQSAGVCHQGTCEQTAPGELVESWRYAASPDVQNLLFDGVTDSQGNVYWLECQAAKLGADIDASTCAVASATAAGVVRYDVDLPLLFPTVPQRQLIAGNLFVAASGTGRVFATDLDTGAMVWSAPLDPLTIDTRITGAQLSALAANDTHVFVLLGLPGTSPDLAALYVLDLATGAVTVTTALSAYAVGLVIDANGNAYTNTFAPTTMTPSMTIDSLISYMPDGSPRWSVVTQDAFIVAELNGELMTSGSTLRSAIDGSQLVGEPGPFCNLPTGQVVMSGAARWTVGGSVGCCPECATPTPPIPTPPIPAGPIALTSMTAGTATVRFSTDVASQPVDTGLVLLSDSSVLMASRKAGDPGPVLRSIDNAGTEVFACALPQPPPGSGGSIGYGPAVALTHGNWVVLHLEDCPSCVVNPPPSLQAFATPGLTEASTGWTGLNGGPSRAGRPH